jgi:integrase
MSSSVDSAAEPVRKLTPNELDLLHRMRFIDKGEGCHAAVARIGAEYQERPGRSVSHTRAIIARLRRKGFIHFAGIHADRGTCVYLIDGVAYKAERLPKIDPLRTGDLITRYSLPSKSGSPFTDDTARAILSGSAPRTGGAAIECRGIYVPSTIHRNYGERTWRAAVDSLLASFPNIGPDGRRFGPSGPLYSQSKLLAKICARLSEAQRVKDAENAGKLRDQIEQPTKPAPDLADGATVAELLASMPGYKPAIYHRADPPRKTEPAPADAPVTVRTLLEREVAFRGLTNASRTADTYRHYLSKLCAQLGELPACQVNEPLIVAYVESRKGDAAKHRKAPRLVSIRRETELLRSALTKAYRRGEIPRDPALWWPKIKASVTPKTRYLKTKDDFNKVSNVLRGYKRSWLWWATLTGGDYGELLAVRRSDIDLEAGTLHIRGTKAKGRDRIVPLNRRLVSHIRKLNLPQDAAILKPWRNRIRDLRKACQEAGLDYVVNLKDLRRTFATWARRGGVPSNEVGALLGHAKGSRMTDLHYAQSDPGRWRDLLDKLL